MDSRSNYLRRKLMMNTTRWYQLKHFTRDPHVRLWASLVIGVLSIMFYFIFIYGLPSLSDIKNDFKESTIIYDKDG